MAKNAAVEKMAAAINNPEAHQMPPSGQAVSGEGGPAVPDPTPSVAAKGNPTHQIPIGTPANPPQPPVVPQGATPPAGTTPPATPPATPPPPAINEADLAAVSARLKELAGDSAVDATEALAANINERLAKARQQEKDKLYQQIEQQKSDLAAAQKLASEQAAIIKNLSEGKTTDGQPKPPPKPKEGDAQPQGLTEEQVTAALEVGLAKMQGVYEEKMGELRNQISALTEHSNKETVEAYRTSLIEANKGHIIEELVTGNTKDELDNNLVQAKQAFAKYATNITQDGQAAASRAPSVPPAPTLNANPPGGASATGGPSLTIPGSMDAFSKDRPSILAAASKAAKEALRGLGPS